MCLKPLEIAVLGAGNGDAIVVSFHDKDDVRRHILIDGGNRPEAYRGNLFPVVQEIADKNLSLDLVIATHQDQDHIKGLIWLLRDLENGALRTKDERFIRQYWFNGPEQLGRFLATHPEVVKDISFKEAQDLENRLVQVDSSDASTATVIRSLQVVAFFGAQLTILSPDGSSLKRYHNTYSDVSATHSDYSNLLSKLIEVERQNTKTGFEQLDTGASNASSIAFLFERGTRKILFLGDAVPHVLDTAIEALLEQRNETRLHVDLVKLSHHGSSRSLSRRFLSLVQSKRYVFSTDGIRHHHPHKSTVAKILAAKQEDDEGMTEFFFNEPSLAEKLTCTESEMAHYKFSFHGPNTHRGYRFCL